MPQVGLKKNKNTGILSLRILEEKSVSPVVSRMLKSGEMSPTLCPTRLLLWSSPRTTTGGLLADGISVGNDVFDSRLGRTWQRIFVQPKAPFEQKQLLQ